MFLKQRLQLIYRVGDDSCLFVGSYVNIQLSQLSSNTTCPELTQYLWVSDWLRFWGFSIDFTVYLPPDCTVASLFIPAVCKQDSALHWHTSHTPEKYCGRRALYNGENVTCAKLRVFYLGFHVQICEDRVEITVGHSVLFPQLCDEILVLQILLFQTFHGLVILCKDATQNPINWSTNQRDKYRRLQIAPQSASFVLTAVQRDMRVFQNMQYTERPLRWDQRW